MKVGSYLVNQEKIFQQLSFSSLMFKVVLCLDLGGLILKLGIPRRLNVKCKH